MDRGEPVDEFAVGELRERTRQERMAKKQFVKTKRDAVGRL